MQTPPHTRFSALEQQSPARFLCPWDFPVHSKDAWTHLDTDTVDWVFAICSAWRRVPPDLREARDQRAQEYDEWYRGRGS
ncbi:hypothetical protein CapIbe_004586 [Capra ibex]